MMRKLLLWFRRSQIRPRAGALALEWEEDMDSKDI